MDGLTVLEAALRAGWQLAHVIREPHESRFILSDSFGNSSTGFTLEETLEGWLEWKSISDRIKTTDV